VGKSAKCVDAIRWYPEDYSSFIAALLQVFTAVTRSIPPVSGTWFHYSVCTASMYIGSQRRKCICNEILLWSYTLWEK